MEEQYVISVRRIRKGEFIAEPGRLRYLKVPESETAAPEHEIPAGEWVDEVRDLADGLRDSAISPQGDVVIFVHGYNNDIPIIKQRHAQLQSDLRAEGWRGLVVSFDWPSDDSTLNYLEDRSDAAQVAQRLVSRGIKVLAKNQKSGCGTNVHLLGHSTGAYVIMEAFAAAEQDGSLFKSDWRVAQVAFIGGDVSSGSLSGESQWAQPMFRRIMRLTNYSNPCDFVLAASNAKRLGTVPRAGRIGLPGDTPRKACNVDCGDYFQTLDPKREVFYGTFAHSWHIGNRLFARDLAMTLEGLIDRAAIPTRRDVNGNLVLHDAGRPRFQKQWFLDRPGAHAPDP